MQNEDQRNSPEAGIWFQMLQWIAAAFQMEVEHYMTISNREGISVEKWQELPRMP